MGAVSLSPVVRFGGVLRTNRPAADYGHFAHLLLRCHGCDAVRLMW
jgi:hypothetical protein